MSYGLEKMEFGFDFYSLPLIKCTTCNKEKNVCYIVNRCTFYEDIISKCVYSGCNNDICNGCGLTTRCQVCKTRQHLRPLPFDVCYSFVCNKHVELNHQLHMNFIYIYITTIMFRDENFYEPELIKLIISYQQQ